MQSISHYIANPRDFGYAVVFRLSRLPIPDKLYLQLLYYLKMGKRLDLKRPKRFTEKLQWLKLYNQRPEYVQMVDKVTAKSWAAERIGDQYIVPLYGIYKNTDEINLDELPNSFVLKCNHLGGGNSVVIVKDKTSFDFQKAFRNLDKLLKRSLYPLYREWLYKHVTPMIMAEAFLEDTDGIKDYKLYCFNGKVNFFKIVFDNSSGHHANFYNRDCELIDLCEVDTPVDKMNPPAMPSNITQMMALAETLSRGIPFLRVDFYDVGGKIYFGETTFFPTAGFDIYGPDGADEWMGQQITLPKRYRADKEKQF